MSTHPDSLVQQVMLNASARYGVLTQVQFSTEEVGKLSGVSQRQLQWWDESGIVCPKKMRGDRVYSARDAISAMLVAELRRKGFSLQRVRLALSGLRRVVAGDIADLMAGRSDLYLVIDDQGRRFQFTMLREQALDYAIRSKRPVLVIPVQPLVKAMLGKRLKALEGK